jgi:hypothetical protein
MNAHNRAIGRKVSREAIEQSAARLAARLDGSSCPNYSRACCR